MKYLRDPLGRPIKRLYLKREVLDKRCEGIIREFMQRRSGGFKLPIPTEELERLIEERAEFLDTYADLPEGVHGRTSLFYNRRPQVRIAESIHRTLSDHLVRTTLCHEFGHVWLHGPLWREAGLAEPGAPGPIWTCNRDAIIEASEKDWMEWQAGWVSGAILMPATLLRAWAAELAQRANVRLPFSVMSRTGGKLIHFVSEQCDVSQLAARVRLVKLGLLVERANNLRGGRG
jgi:Zn-dependent peptidase ImmA (M78 family)